MGTKVTKKNQEALVHSVLDSDARFGDKIAFLRNAGLDVVVHDASMVSVAGIGEYTVAFKGCGRIGVVK